MCIKGGHISSIYKKKSKCLIFLTDEVSHHKMSCTRLSLLYKISHGGNSGLGHVKLPEVLLEFSAADVRGVNIWLTFFLLIGLYL